MLKCLYDWISYILFKKAFILFTDENLIKKYFIDGYYYKEILDLLKTKHDIDISLSTLRRTLAVLKLRRKFVEESNLEDIILAVVKELNSSGYNLGYKSLWRKLKFKHGLNVKRDNVLRILRVADPEGVAQRFGNRLRRRQYLSPGPNHTWNLDGYDKLMHFGFGIHGCVDGFSRLIMWLEIATTNSDPKVTAYYFLKTVLEFGFLGNIVRCDAGTENCLIESLQTCLRSQNTDKNSGLKSFICGKSTANQRIESYWGRMRNYSMYFYIQLFKVMQEEGLYNGSSIHRKCLQFCFGPLMKHDLDMTKHQWNTHCIRKQAARNNISGKPEVMFYCPERYDAENFKREVNLTVVQKLMDKLTTKPVLFDPLFEELVKIYIPDVTTPKSADEALKLYKNILYVLGKEGKVCFKYTVNI